MPSPIYFPKVPLITKNILKVVDSERNYVVDDNGDRVVIEGTTPPLATAKAPLIDRSK